jgi:hypothetical protein
MSDKKDVKGLPLIYKIILKFPKLSVESFSSELQGLFWAVGLPLFVIGVFFLNFALLVLLYFPFNYLAVGVINFMIVMFIARIYVERSLNLEKALLHERGFKWDIIKTTHEYSELLKKKEKSEEDVEN